MKKISFLRIRALALVLFCGFFWNASADDLFKTEQLKVQKTFSFFAKDLVNALAYKPLTPSEQLGILGVDIGVAFNYSDLPNLSSYASAINLPANIKFLVIPALTVHKGLPFGFDVGLSYLSISGVSLLGGELRYAVLSDGLLTPEVAVRINGNSLSGVSGLGLNTFGYDISVAKKFLLGMLTPYGGIGQVQGSVSPNFSNGLLTKETVSSNKIFAGLGLRLALFHLDVELDRTGETNNAGIKFSFRL